MLSTKVYPFTKFTRYYDWNDMGAFVGPKLPHSFSTSIIKTNARNDNNNNNNNNNINNNKNKNLEKQPSKKSLSRMKSRSLDSINKLFTDLNTSTIFDEDIDKLFPPLCRHYSPNVGDVKKDMTGKY